MCSWVPVRSPPALWKAAVRLSEALPSDGTWLGAPATLGELPLPWDADGQCAHKQPGSVPPGTSTAGATRAEREARGDAQRSIRHHSPPGISAAAVCSSMQQYIHTTVWVHAQPEKNSLKNGSFHGMPYSPSDTDFSNLKDQLF